MGKALHAACGAARVNDRFQESIYLVLELLRAGVVHGGKWGGPDAEPLSGGPSFGTEEEQSSTLLIMRVLSVLPLSFKVGLLLVKLTLASTMGRASIARASRVQLVCQGLVKSPPTFVRSGNGAYFTLWRCEAKQGRLFGHDTE